MGASLACRIACGRARCQTCQWGTRSRPESRGRSRAVIPGFVDTPITAGVFADPAWLARVTRDIPLGRAGKPEEIAAFNLWLRSDEASYAVGGYFVADGGTTAT